MKIILTLSGNSERFTSRGYPIKSLITIDNKKIINYVLDMFPNVEDKDFLFIVKKEDINQYNIQNEILNIKKSNVFKIEKNNFGPVYSISNIFDNIPDDEEIIVSYCDITQKWNFDDFLKFCRESNSDGCLVTHVGFVPHKLYNKSFAFLTVNESDNTVSYVHEKKPIDQVKPKEPASNGIYYFKSGALLKKYFKKLMDDKISVNGEYYVTVPYNLMIQDGLKITHYVVNNYVSLGIPTDVECFKSWKHIIENSNVDEKTILDTYKFWKGYFN
jgi:bifunctional N-acetylglucosamine-1-phosphate-uridyltransferase/glucosamine-1-phosphate-acetyltransferase GlmU-like protein